jgi:hypothetical protein
VSEKPLTEITCPERITSPLWEGELAPSETQMSGQAAGNPVVTLGKPLLWSLQDDHDGRPPNPFPRPTNLPGDYWLLQLDCSLRPPSGRDLVQADLSLELTAPNGDRSDSQPRVVTMYPELEDVDDTQERSVYLSVLNGVLQFLLTKVGLGALIVKTTIQFNKRFPVIQGFGAGTSNASWQFRDHQARRLEGTQSVFAVIVLPPGIDHADAQLDVTATVQASRWDRIRFRVPAPQKGQTRFRVPEKQA